MSYRKLSALAAIAAAMLMLGSFGTALAAPGGHIWYVDDDGLAGANGCNGTNVVPTAIQVAIDAASPGDNVFVCPGSYTGPIEMSKNGLTVAAVKPWETIVRPAPGVTDPIVSMHDARNMKLRWLRIVVPTALPCVNLEAVVSIVNAEHVRIRANHIGPDPDASGTDCIFLSGIDAQSSANAQILFNRVTGFDDYGIVVNTAMDGTRIARNLVRATYLHAAAQPVYDYGLLNSDNVTMTYNYAYGRSDVQTGDLRYFVGVTADGGTIGTITNNHFVDETLAISTAATTGGTITYNHAVSGIATGIRIGGQSAEIAYNRFSGTGVGIGANNASADNDIHDNNALGPSDPDCSDFSTGTGTAGTANTWTDNLGDTSSPAGICGPAS